jgi:CRP/FNR family transcriptional regulator, cyclic AMP receptor protein
VLFHQGDDPGAVMVIRAGRIKVSVSAPDGHDVMLGFIGPGTLIGDLSAIDGEPRSTTATAVEEVEVLGITMITFRAMLEERPALMMALLKTAAQRLRAADRQRVEFSAFDVLGRVARRIDGSQRTAARPKRESRSTPASARRTSRPGPRRRARQSARRSARCARSAGSTRAGA